MFHKDGVASSSITVTVDNIYPGMPTFTRTVRVNNRGEMAADLGYEVSRLKVLNNTYTAGNGGNTSDNIKTRMQNNYPFSINVTTDRQTVAANNGTADYTITITWPYESGDDDADTYWGNQAYSFHQNNPTEECIVIDMTLLATQSH